MKQAYLVIGPEASGTKLLTACLIAMGAYGDAGNDQRLDEDMTPGHTITHGGPIVLRRSVPHGSDRLSADRIIWEL